MGEAKKRGSFEQRKAEAGRIEAEYRQKQQQEIDLQNKLLAEQRANETPEERQKRKTTNSKLSSLAVAAMLASTMR